MGVGRHEVTQPGHGFSNLLFWTGEFSEEDVSETFVRYDGR